MRDTVVLSVLAAAVVAMSAATSAEAGVVLDRVRTHGVVRCGAYERPGLAEAGEDDGGPWKGLDVEICRAVATAVLGDASRITFHGYAGRDDLQALGAGDDDVSFLTGSEITANGMTSRLVPGPAVFIESHAVMVPVGGQETSPADLAGDGGVCYMSGSPVEASLAAYFGTRDLKWRPVAYSEDGEMIDAYNVHQCKGVAYELTTLATVPQDKGVNNQDSRILPEPLVSYPVLATTPATDAAWAITVAWTIHSLAAADRPASRWTVGGVKSMPAALGDFGLAKDWQDRVITAVGGYHAIYDRTLGAGSALKLPYVPLPASPVVE